MIANTTMNTNERYRRTFVIVACPRNGTMNCTRTASTMTAALPASSRCTPSWLNIATTISTTRTMPSISKPTCVTQLNSDGTRLPLRPNGARLTMNAVVPVSGPGRLAQPKKA